MSCELKEGVRLHLVGLPETSDGQIGFWIADLSSNYGVRCKSITVSMEVGQMAEVPWARCEREDGTVDLVNLAQVEIVTLANAVTEGK